MKRFYISTPIYYPSGKPHIGHAYSTILADVFSRYKKLIGCETFFITGTDEHGKKIQESAAKEGITPKEFVDRNSKVFDDLWEKLGIKYDRYIRTTEDNHKKIVQKVFSKFYSKNLIYLSEWKGLYCISCEENYTIKDATKKGNEFFCQHGHKLVNIDEESFFFKMSEYQDWIKEKIKNDKDFITPNSRSNELINNFLNDKLVDLSISRTSFSWGITINEKDNHVIYVWLDALMNYITGLGYETDDDSLFQKFWMSDESEKVHIIAKEITRFHCIYWPIFLHALNLPLPDKIISHGWIITPEGKMSKSIGNVIDPYELLKMFNREMIRYYFIKDMNVESDNVFSTDMMLGTYNGDLVNNYGNLISRTLGMLKKYFNNAIPKYFDNNVFINEFNLVDVFNKKCFSLADDLKIKDLLLEIQNIINVANKLIETKRPWELFKNQKFDELSSLLTLLFKIITSTSFWLQPILIDSITKVETQTNIKISGLNFEKLFDNNLNDNIICSDGSPIFERQELKKEHEKVKIKG